MAQAEEAEPVCGARFSRAFGAAPRVRGKAISADRLMTPGIRLTQSGTDVPVFRTKKFPNDVAEQWVMPARWHIRE